MDAAAAEIGVDVTSHDLRHFYASALIAGGASVKQVQKRLGHSTAVITLNTYAHLWPGDDDRTRDVIDSALTPLADSLRTAEVSDA
jgi:integrase